MSFVSRAKAAFFSGDYAQAVALYEQAIAERPELAATYRFNLNLARAKLGLPPAPAPSVVSTATLAAAASAGAVADAPVLTLDDLYRQVEHAARSLPVLPKSDQLLVSVLMTAHNVEDYIEAAVTSVLRQTWARLELIVVDDASSDDTWPILQRLQKSEPGLRCRRLNTNLGTYFAKNYGLQLARGDYVFFQDGDDICHPERIRLGMQQLMAPGVVCVRAAYSRVRFPSGRVVPVNGAVHRLGLITLGLRRQVFGQIGYFNCTSKASDEEFFNRLKLWVASQGHRIIEQRLPLYYNTLREGSLFADMIANDPEVDGNIEQRPSPSRASYVEAFTDKHRELGPGGFKGFFLFPVLRDLIPVEPDMTRLPNPDAPVVASLCSIPERVSHLKRVLASLAPQVDELHLYLDRYDEVPDFVRQCHPRVSVVLSRDRPGLRDNGKFLPFAALARDCYYFTADDDLVYPPDYVASMIRRIEHYGRQAVVGVHGVLLPQWADGYFSAYRKVYGFRKGLERDMLVNNLGSGTVAFHSSLLRGLDLGRFPRAGMADLYLSVFCKERRVPMIAVARPDDWLHELPSPNTSLHQEFRDADDQQTALISAHQPWGYVAIRQAVAAVANRVADDEIGQRLQKMVPLLHDCLR